MRFLLIGNPGSNRCEFFRSAAVAAGCAVEFIAWKDLLIDSPLAWRQIEESKGAVIRLESPGRDAGVERLLLCRGYEVLQDDCNSCWSPERIGELLPCKGLITPTHQWYAGWKSILERVQAAAAGAPFSHPPSEILTMFNKAETQETLSCRGMPVPPRAGVVSGYRETLQTMAGFGWERVFLKPLYGSSASGIVALERSRHGQQAFSPVELDQSNGAPLLYNSRRVRRYGPGPEIEHLVDVLGRSGLLMERWIPKLGFAGMRCDLRVFVVNGRARHVVARLSRHPMTNLHLGGIRGDVGALRQLLGEERWNHALQVCEDASGAFPGSISAGVDLLLAAGCAKPFVLEMNAFGGLLPGALHAGHDTYRCEVDALLERHGAA